MMEQGLLLKGVGGFYDALVDGQTVRAKARGVFRKQGITPMIGDRVTIVRQKEGHAFLTEILPRRNMLVRPAVANVDRLMIVISAEYPEPDWLLADKLILQARAQDIEPVLVLNKMDRARPEVIDTFRQDYGHFPTLLISALTGEGLGELRAALTGLVCCFAGQSAVGKSSVLNALLPELNLAVGELSQKTDRGRHTTRHAQLIPLFGGAVLDTPGFSLLELLPEDQATLDVCYPEFAEAGPCRFSGCRHLTEPDCGVLALLNDGRLTQGRYRRYSMIAEEIEARRKRRYD
ncbi:MAG: ribosome small subunit-dependent GTPase A [Clostridiales bacterium]|nr:ribosome small subunit-dependent GTPase A [Clostridiales bacterium]